MKLEGFTYSVGWKKKEEISFYGKKIAITVKIQAYDEQSDMTAEQKSNYDIYEKSFENIIANALGALKKYDNDAESRFTPTTLLLKRDGNMGLLFDDKNDEDGGIVVDISADYTIVQQDDYL